MFTDNTQNWRKWRLTYEGGRRFVDRYLERFSARESHSEFNSRRRITYCPAFAKAAINDVKNSIFQRISDVTREGGPASYQTSIQGLNGGVDRLGSSMNTFIGRDILPDLLVMGKVGLFLDREIIPDNVTLATRVKAPYLYVYKIEDIVEYTQNEFGETDYIVLRERTDNTEYLRTFMLIDGIVTMLKGNDPPVTLKLTKIPFVLLTLSESLMMDISDYQIALLNTESSDLIYILKSNYPFYVEQVDGRSEGTHLKKNETEEVETGSHHGRTYPRGLDQPAFIAPPTEPIVASMKKQEQMKADIRLLLNLSIQNLQPSTMASADSKIMDDRTLEAGLSYIGLELEYAERQLSFLWSMYEGSNDIATIKYPATYSIKSDDEILKEVEALKEQMKNIPSETYKKEVAKIIAMKMLGSKVSRQTLEKILTEIDNSRLLTTDPDLIFQSIENSVITLADAATALGLPNDPKSLATAAAEHAERAARIAQAQASVSHDMASRGVKDMSANSNAPAQEKKIAEQAKGNLNA